MRMSPWPRLARNIRQALGVSVLALLAACGGGGGGAADAVVPPVTLPSAGPDFSPLAVGDAWVYLRNDGVVERRSVTGTKVVDGQSALVVSDTDFASGSTESSTFRKTASAITEVPDGSDALLGAVGAIDSLRLPLRVGDSYTQVDKSISGTLDIDRDGRPDTVTVRATVTVLASESITVAAGSFADCLKVRTQLTLSGVGSSSGQATSVVSVADEWYAPEIGVVRSRLESNGDGVSTVETRELRSYRVGSRSNDTAAPKIVSTTPAVGATVGTRVALTLDFDEPIDGPALGAGAVTVVDAGGAVVGNGLSTVSGSRLQSNLPAPLAPGVYTIRLASTVQDALGNRIAPQQWTITVDGSGPGLASSLPAANGVLASLTDTLELRFDEAVDAGSVAGAIRLIPAVPSLDVGYSFTMPDARTVRIVPSQPLRPQAAYQISIGALRDVQGNAAASVTSVPFRTPAGLFQAPVEVNAFINDTAVAVGDVSGDGRADLLGVAILADGLVVRRQLADGSLAAASSVPLRASTVCNPDSIQIADLNGDGRNDVVVAERSCGIEILLQNAAGGLEPGAFLPSADSHIVRAADMNGDGRIDLVGIGLGTGTVSVWLQRAGGWDAAMVIAFAHLGSLDMALGDINGDGRPDIVVASGGDGPPGKGLGLLLQRADGGFDAGGYLTVDPTWGAWGVAIGDLNGDGRADVVSGFSGAGLALFLQGSDSRLLPMQVLSGYSEARYLKILDVSGDGRLDLVARQSALTPVVVATQQADGTLQRAQQLENQLFSSTGADRLAVGDLNGDGALDLILSGPRVMYGVPRPAAPSGVARPGPRPLRSVVKSWAVR